MFLTISRRPGTSRKASVRPVASDAASYTCFVLSMITVADVTTLLLAMLAARHGRGMILQSKILIALSKKPHPYT